MRMNRSTPVPRVDDPLESTPVSSAAQSSAEPEGTIVVCESRPFWHPELQRQLAGAPFAVSRCVHLDDVAIAVRSAGGGVAVVGHKESPERVLRFLVQVAADLRSFLRICVIGTGNGGWEWTLRELGAAAVVEDTISGERLARLCREQCTQVRFVKS